MLVFNKSQILKRHMTHECDVPVNIIEVDTIQVQCNIEQVAYKSREEEHTIHSVSTIAEPFFKIIKTLNNVVYLLVNVQRVDYLTLFLVDQDSGVINFRGEVMTVRVKLKQIA